MYQSFEARNFRCFRKLALTDLERVNLIAGMNNVGKTALLEALFLHCGAYNPNLTLSLSALRGIELVKVEFSTRAEAPWDALFPNFDTSKTVELLGKNTTTGQRTLRLRAIRDAEELAKVGGTIVQEGQEAGDTDQSETTISPVPEEVQVLQLEYEAGEGFSKYYYVTLSPKGRRVHPIPPPAPFPAIFLAARYRTPLPEDAERFGKLETIGQQEVVKDALRVIEPRLTRVAVIVAGGVPMIHGDIGLDRLIPLPVMGEGMSRLASLVVAIGNAPDGVVLVDEIENGLHHSVLNKVWRAVGEAAREFNTQVFATTHSFECIAAAHEAFSEGERYDFRLHRLDRMKETKDIRAVTYDQETLEAAIEGALEVR